MVRRLPWEQAADHGNGPSPRSSIPARPRRPKQTFDSSDVEQATPRKQSRSRSIRDLEPVRERARSSSVPLQPPKEEFMLDGFDNEDRYRMVEDEFLDIAKEYTQHLHAAEYLRLKSAARNRSSATISSIERPVTGGMPDATKRMLEGIERAKKQADAVAELKRKKPKYEVESEEDAPEPWLGTALHGLMEEPRAQFPTVTDVVETAVASKAAKGYKGNKLGRMDSYGLGSGSDTDQAPARVSTSKANQRGVGTESDEDDDLDAPLLPKPSITPWQLRLPVSSPPSVTIETEVKIEPGLPPRRRQYATSTSTEESTNLVNKGDEGVVELPRTSADILARMVKRRELARRKRDREDEDARREEVKKRKGIDVIPTFL